MLCQFKQLKFRQRKQSPIQNKLRRRTRAVLSAMVGIFWKFFFIVLPICFNVKLFYLSCLTPFKTAKIDVCIFVVNFLLNFHFEYWHFSLPRCLSKSIVVVALRNYFYFDQISIWITFNLIYQFTNYTMHILISLMHDPNCLLYTKFTKHTQFQWLFLSLV